MVRVFIKGGVWKNSEDEILKAAVMKYGKQQWARVASLLNRKSAKQCKARWNEWLDPSVRKVEWSRAEEEKLLHLAKLMPAQWRTIGPLVGRTATQCQEHYERLLDEAAAAAAAPSTDGAAAGSDTASAAAMATAAAPRKLRPGEIDPHPETKPARPDPIDMDEDEIEMLQEARARLANTQGKKAKRKAREKMLAEAKRLADLQKRRELKQAGLLSGMARTKARGKRKREIDLGVEIPFHKPAPAGFHSTEEENFKAESVRQRRKRDIDYKKVNESQVRARDREIIAAKKKEENRLRSLERSNMQYVVAEVSKRNDPLAQRKRGVLKMPEPEVSEEELRRVAKLGSAVAADGGSVAKGGGISATGSATDALLGDYSDRPLPTPMRTPATGGSSSRAGVSSHEVILREASNLRMIERGETPLLGGMNPELKEGGAGTGVGLKNDDVKLASKATPMIGMTPSATPMGSRKTNQTPLSLAPRDELGLNRPSSEMHPSLGDDDAASVSASSFASTAVGTMSIKEIAREERRAAKKARMDLELALASLPAPQFEYELAVPDQIPDDDEGHIVVGPALKDAAEEDAEEVERLRKEAERSYEERSTVVKRPDLPRPVGAVPRACVLPESSSDELDVAEKMVMEETLTLLQHDAHAHPVIVDDPDQITTSGNSGDTKQSKKNKKKKRKKGGSADNNVAALAPPPPPDKALDYLSEDALDAAKVLLQEEADAIIMEKRNKQISESNYRNDEELQQYLSWENMTSSRSHASSLAYLDESKFKKGWISVENERQEQTEEYLASLHTEYSSLKNATDTLKKRSDKLESKLAIRNGGYAKRSIALRDSILQNFAELQNSRIEEAVYSTLLSHEKRGSLNRVEKLESEIERLEKDEAAAQKRYGDLLHEKNRIMVQIRHHQKKEGTN
mmetsp:Transcript_21819/g.32105  ORF Transcript_21819/g.32105 Transcript_21819/m.32105 type:complete len:913 (+) Transcript_21819:138-2876(+)